MGIIPNKVYRGLIQGLSDTTDGKYKIHIPALMSHDNTFKYVMAKNCVSTYGKWIDPTTKEVKSIGTYIPLQIGMLVYVTFDTENYDSAQITGLIFDEIPLNKDDQENFYLFGKTKNGTFVYSDDSRNITHIMHHNGLSNVIMMDDKITLSINETSAVGNNNYTTAEFSQDSIILTVGNTSLLLDESGMTITTKDNKWEFGNKEMNFKTSKFNVDCDDFAVSATKAFINGREETHIKSTVARVTGGQHLSLNGNVVNVEAVTNATFHSTGSTTIKGTTSLFIDGSAHLNISSDGLLTVDGTQVVVKGINTTLDSTTLVLSASAIFEDSQVIRGMGTANAMGTSMNSMATGMNLAMSGINTALTTAFHFNDPFSGMACNSISELALPGVAQGSPTQLPVVDVSPNFDYVNSTIRYMTVNTSIGDVGTVDNINNLNGNSFLSVFNKTSS